MACSIGSHGEVRRLFKLKPAFVRPIRPVCRNQFVLRSARIIAMKACTVLAGPRSGGDYGQTLKRNSTSYASMSVRLSGSLSVAPGRRGDVDLVALGVGERPPRGRRVADHPPAGREGRGDARPSQFGRHPDVDVEAVALRAGRVHVLEPDRRTAPAWVDKVLLRAVGASLVAEHGRPEWHHVGADQRVDGYLDGLDQRRVGGEPLLAGQV